MTPAPACHRCRQPLSGAYVQALDADWHPECWRCAECDGVLEGPFVPRDGRPYHPACHDRRFGLRCALCGGLIQGTYYEHQGQPVCERDYRAALAPRCFHCGQVLEGTYRTNDHGQLACSRHARGPSCASCQRWLGPEPPPPPLDGFDTTLCRSCAGGAVGRRALAGYGLGFGRRALANLGLDLDPGLRVPLSLEPAAVLRAGSGADPTADGITRTLIHTVNDREVSREVEAVAVVGGLAREHFEGVLAHEFGHVWLFHNRFDHLSRRQAEGFCELVKYLWLEGLGSPLARAIQGRMHENPDPVYGEGFRWLHGTWAREGSPGLQRSLGIHLKVHET